MKPLVFSILLTALAPTGAPAQTTLYTFDETEAEAAAGASVAIWTDLNADGHAEWVVGAPGQDSTGGVDAGRVTILSGIDHSVYDTLDGAVAAGRFGRSVANAGDVNGDDIDDLAVGAEDERAVHVFSGADLSLLWSQSEPLEPRFGYAVAAAGDVDADGFKDVVVGAPGFGAMGDGWVFVYDGEDGSELFSYSNPSRRYGFSVSGAGDVNGDGFDDVLSGAPFSSNGKGVEGAAIVLGGPSGTVLKEYVPDSFDERGMEFGFSVAPAGDVDGDGFDDYAIGARWYGWIHLIAPSWVGVFSGATHTEIWRATGPLDRWFGYSMASAGDIDLDGVPDLIVGDPLGADVYVYSPAQDRELFRFEGAYPDFYGTSVAGGGDVDADGWGDLVLGASLDDEFNEGSGSAILFTYGCWPDAAYGYCEAAPNSAGPGALMSHQNSTSIAANNLRLVATGCPPNQLSLFLQSKNQNQFPSGNGFFCLGGPFYRIYPASPTGGSGTPTKNLDIGNPPSPAAQILPGSTWNFINWYRDPPAGGAGYNYSNGLMVTFCP